MELIDKAKVYNLIAELENKYQKLVLSETNNTNWRMYNEILKDLSYLKFTIYDMEELKEDKHQCIICGYPVKHSYSICKECQNEGAKERDEYVKHCMEVIINETHP